MDCSLLGSSLHGILQARILEWVAISFSRGSSQPRDQTQVSSIAGRFLTIWAIRETIYIIYYYILYYIIYNIHYINISWYIHILTYIYTCPQFLKFSLPSGTAGFQSCHASCHSTPIQFLFRHTLNINHCSFELFFTRGNLSPCKYLRPMDEVH